MPTTAAPTLKDIARATGCSLMTVSRVLRGAPKVSAEKREQVLKEAKRLNYQPDPHLARMMQVVRGKKQQRVRAVIAVIREKSPILREMLDKGEIGVVGGMYDLRTGKVRFQEKVRQ